MSNPKEGSRRGQRAKKKADLQGRRDALVLIARIGAGAAMLAVGVGLYDYLNRPKIDAQFSDEFLEGVTAQELKAIQSAVTDYVSFYGSPIPAVQFSIANYSGKSTQQGTVTENVLEEAYPGIVIIDVDHIRNTNSQPLEALRNISLHAMTHALQIPSTPLTESIPLIGQGYFATATQGMSFIVQQPDGAQTRFTKIEEGVSEALAQAIDPLYAVPHPGYFEVGSLTKYLMDTFFPSPQYLAKLTQSNGLLEFIATVKGKNQEDMVNADILQVMKWYLDLYNLQAKHEDIINEVWQYRAR